MSTSTMTTAVKAEQRPTQPMHSATPSFLGIVRGEFFKIGHQWATWIMTFLLVCVNLLPYILTFTAKDPGQSLKQTPLSFYYNHFEGGLAIMRVFGGIFLIVLTATAIGQEYQLGTIRILLARGVGRLQLLAAKLLMVVIVGLLIIVGCLLLNALATVLVVLILAGDLNSLNSLTPTFWSDVQVYLLTILVSMGASILMATAMAVIGRSLTLGLSLALAWFPVDNIGTIFLVLAMRLTHQDFWLNITGYLLGPTLNKMPAVVGSSSAFTIGTQPFVTVTGTQTLLVALVYSVVFAVVAVVLTWRRDVKE